jgi:hypothetical protein
MEKVAKKAAKKVPKKRDYYGPDSDKVRHNIILDRDDFHALSEIAEAEFIPLNALIIKLCKKRIATI